MLARGDDLGASTEIFLKQHAVHKTIDSFEKAMRDNHKAIAPSMIYAYAALKSGIPFANGAPNLTVDIPALTELADKNKLAICGKDFKTGQTLMKTIIAPGLKARMLGLHGWYSTNILGNRDGEVLDDPESFKTKEESKLSVLEYILQPEVYPRPLQRLLTRGPDQLLPAARRQQGRLGQHRHLRLARLPDADQDRLPLPRFNSGGADRAGPGAVSGSRAARRNEGHSGVAVVLLQSSANRAGLYPEHDIFIQLMKLKNTLRHLRGEDLITHLGLEYYD